MNFMLTFSITNPVNRISVEMCRGLEGQDTKSSKPWVMSPKRAKDGSVSTGKSRQRPGSGSRIKPLRPGLKSVAPENGVYGLSPRSSQEDVVADTALSFSPGAE